MNITIEKAAPSDAAEFLEYLRQVGKETDNLTFGSEGVPFTVEAEAEYLKNSEGSRDSIMLVAKKDGKIIGNAALAGTVQQLLHTPSVERSRQIATASCHVDLGGNPKFNERYMERMFFETEDF